MRPGCQGGIMLCNSAGILLQLPAAPSASRSQRCFLPSSLYCNSIRDHPTTGPPPVGGIACMEIEGLAEAEAQLGRRVHFAKEPAEEEGSACSPEIHSWKIRALDAAATPPPSSVLSADSCTPASAALLESARKVDDLRNRLQSLEEALQAMEAKAVQQLDKHLQEKVLATAMKLVERRFNDKELDRKIQEHVLTTAMKMVAKRSAVEEDKTVSVELCKKLELDFAPKQSGVQPSAPPEPAAEDPLEQFAAHIEAGLGQVVRRLEKKVDALQYLVDNNVFDALEARVTEVLGGLEQRIAALEGGAAQGSGAGGAGTAVTSLAVPEAALPQTAAASTRSQIKEEAAVSSIVGSPAGYAEQPAGEVSHGTPGQETAVEPAHLRRRSPTTKLAATSQAGAALQSALLTAKAQIAKSEAATATAKRARSPWWRTFLHVLGWAILGALGLAACMAGMLSVAVRDGRTLPLDYLS